MSNEIPLDVVQTALLRIGSETTLTAATPAGLFKADCGNKYLLLADGAAKVAVALDDRVLPRFTWVGLCGAVIEIGRWLGPYRICLTHQRANASLSQRPGTICVSAGKAHIHCLSFTGEDCLLPLGRAAGGVLHTGVYDGWSCEIATSQRQFVRRKQTQG
nr:hypothetical protein [uncultured Sphingomonas sp.]